MKFHAYESAYDRRYKDKNETVEQFYQNFRKSFDHIHLDQRLTAIHHCESELRWHLQVRPYYKVYPSIIPALMKIKLDIECTSLDLPETSICLRFAEQKEPIVDGKRLQTMLIYYGKMFDKCNTLSIIVELGGRLILMPPFRFWSGRSLNFFTDLCEQSDKINGVTCAYAKPVVRIATTVLLLANDPQIIEAEVLARDHDKFIETNDPKYIAKARRRGVVGWSIGKEFESCPHYRRPHLALRHTGKGKTVPRIVPVKGTVVHREKITQVPTGYILPTGQEVEV